METTSKEAPPKTGWRDRWKRTLSRWRGEPPEVDLEPFLKLTRAITAEGTQLGAENDDDLRARAADIRSRAIAGTDSEDPLEELLVEVFALVREAADRTIGLRPYDVQILAGVALARCHLIEMQTGEGKTLAAVAPACLQALTGEGVHILTFNDYLARRDALWMGPVYEFLGFTVGFIQEGMAREQRQQAYGCDVTYLTAKEAGFDFLRDRLSLAPADLMQRPFRYALVDEADSILIDEARVPLVIAGHTGGELHDPAEKRFGECLPRDLAVTGTQQEEPGGDFRCLSGFTVSQLVPQLIGGHFITSLVLADARVQVTFPGTTLTVLGGSG